MPTFYDPGADAGEVSALRGLALAGSGFEHPQDMYGVFGDLLHGVRSLRQVSISSQLLTYRTDLGPLITVAITWRDRKTRWLRPTRFVRQRC